MLQVNDLDAPVADIVPLAANAAFPLAVVDEEKVFRGIITKLLSCLPLLPENQQMLKIKEELPKQLFFYLS